MIYFPTIEYLLRFFPEHRIFYNLKRNNFFFLQSINKQLQSTTNLRRHMGFVHNRTEFMYASQQKNYRPKDSKIPPDFKKKLDEKHLEAIILDSRPFNDFSRPGMRSFLSEALPGYKPLHRTTIRKRLRDQYCDHRRKLRNIFQNVSDVALTADLWKNIRGRHFIGLTSHFYNKEFKLISLTLGFRVINGRHTADRLAKFIKKEINFYRIEGKIRCITTDNALNMVNAINKVGLGNHQSCMAHNLNLVIKNTVLPPKKR